MKFLIKRMLFLLLLAPELLLAQPVKVLTNHIGYEFNLPKKAVVVADTKENITGFELIETATGKKVYTGKVNFSGPVDKWKHWLFWTIDFSGYTTKGNYFLRVNVAGKPVQSYPFSIDKNVLEQATISDVVYYFKGQRSSGLLDQADHHLLLAGKTKDTIDAHGGWYDATGDYGKHLSHLSFSSYFNPQQVSLTVWSLLKTYDLLQQKPGTDYRQYLRRIQDEAMYGADYLVRLKAPNGSFYRSVSAPGPGKMAKDRVIRAEDKGYRIKQNKDQSYSSNSSGEDNDWRSYQSSYRSGAGLSIAALAIASTYDTSGEFTNRDYLKAAEEAFAFLEKENARMTNDGKENIVDDYCALSAATELYKATKKPVYLAAAGKRAAQLADRLISKGKYTNYFRADDKDRPFFHPSDAGLPVVALLNYYPLATAAEQDRLKTTIRKSVQYELAVTAEVNNPFGYSRQYTEDTAGVRKTAFFFPQGSEASPWWQGENARLGSIATAARMAAKFFKTEPALSDSLENLALQQLNWILGLNPFDACMLQGSGHNNPAYGFFGTFEYTNAPGGIVNGITGGLTSENDIDFNVSYATTGKDYDWRWAEQWLPHAAWFLLAVAEK
ncbi:glycoside hydrolase family 9 protein [Chitinophaga arvensicola]|uniref:N-terminal ig-like domain of cellulase n=1 Tax=Chitinophaga arvensicola TaxID=29529 RepID=A0A1I0QDI3_9BACT|nr:glycoside hydrolase family 9 protein [Chitinophaga arvensicola]SEW25105.1 N-terminal ig-like domain of cellulase [Chitinophaga arvensicola]